MPPRGIAFFNFLWPCEIHAPKQIQRCGVSMESTIFTKTGSTAACVYAPSRRVVEAREHTSTVLDHLATHIVDIPFFLASSTEERTHECSLPLATAACSRTRHVMHKPRRHPTPHSSQAHGAPASFSLAEGIIRARQLKPEARRSTVSGDWELTRTDATLTRGEEAALDRLRTGVSHTIRMAATTTATRHPTKMLLARRGCRTAGTQRILHGNASSSRWTSPRHDPTPGRLPGVWQALQLPH
ncbi:hypothetical protein TCSYLVIO_006455 [Trypanosoma cruzi]|nr:hypothetical protein TCSYLVIO_006455 [Trypanosoma cruzi]